MIRRSMKIRKKIKAIANHGKWLMVIVLVSCGTDQHNTNAETDSHSTISPSTSQPISAPIYRGCENEPPENRSACLQNNIRQYIHKNFDVGLAKTIGLPAGKNRITVSFEIDEKGQANVLAVDTPYPKLKASIIKLFEKLPVIKPAMKNHQPTSVKYQLPIVFMWVD